MPPKMPSLINIDSLEAERKQVFEVKIKELVPEPSGEPVDKLGSGERNQNKDMLPVGTHGSGTVPVPVPVPKPKPEAEDRRLLQIEGCGWSTKSSFTSSLCQHLQPQWIYNHQTDLKRKQDVRTLGCTRKNRLGTILPIDESIFFKVINSESLKIPLVLEEALFRVLSIKCDEDPFNIELSLDTGTLGTWHVGDQRSEELSPLPMVMESNEDGTAQDRGKREKAKKAWIIMSALRQSAHNKARQGIVESETSSVPDSRKTAAAERRQSPKGKPKGKTQRAAPKAKSVAKSTNLTAGSNIGTESESDNPVQSVPHKRGLPKGQDTGEDSATQIIEPVGKKLKVGPGKPVMPRPKRTSVEVAAAQAEKVKSPSGAWFVRPGISQKKRFVFYLLVPAIRPSGAVGRT
ncbi:hypothetical protein EDB85DRAFT_1900480 [Lactarius pseudohatsudake]|nr:hypothetical protein EDB85DRAFT_1900480 [Lactarius pseudohatsudake]